MFIGYLFLLWYPLLEVATFYTEKFISIITVRYRIGFFEMMTIYKKYNFAIKIIFLFFVDSFFSIGMRYNRFWSWTSLMDSEIYSCSYIINHMNHFLGHSYCDSSFWSIDTLYDKCSFFWYHFCYCSGDEFDSSSIGFQFRDMGLHNVKNKK